MDRSLGTSGVTPPGADTLRFRLLDACRGMAALAVVVYHALTAQLPVRDKLVANPAAASTTDWAIYILLLGSLGVPVFFMISGYCISAAAENHLRNGYSIRRFMHRRLLRIYPPYWACLLICLALSPLPGARIDASGLTSTQWLGNIFLFETYRHWLLPPTQTQLILGASWTLCYEEQFYLLTALLLCFVPRILFRVFGAITLFVILNNYNLNIGPLKQLGDLNTLQINVNDLLIDSFWLFFALGIGLFKFRQANSLVRFAFPMLLALFAWWEIRQLDWTTYRYSSRVFAIACTLSLCFLGPFDKTLSQLRILAPFFWLGTRSYSIYLLHMPLTFLVIHLAHTMDIDGPIAALFVVVPSACCVSIVAGMLFFHYVERHCISGKQRLKPDLTVPTTS